MRRIARPIATAAAAALLASACSGGTAEPAADTQPRPDTAPATTALAATDTAAPETAATTAPATTTTTTTAPAAESPTVTMTDGPLGTVNGRDEHGQGGVLRAAWNVSPADATCTYSLNDTNGNDAVHQAVVENLAAGDTERSIEVLYAVTAGGLPLTLTIFCRTDDGAATVIGETVTIVDPGDQAGETDDGSASAEQADQPGDEPDESDGTEDDETETTEPDAAEPVKNYKNRSPNSVFPANDRYYFDHDEIAALFPECAPFPTSPEVREWLDEMYAHWDAAYAGWDTESVVLGGNRIAAGWWTTQQIRMRHPYSALTGESVRRDASYDSDNDYLYLYSDSETSDLTGSPYVQVPQKVSDDSYSFEDLYRRLELSGFHSVYGDPANALAHALLMPDTGIANDGPNPEGTNVGFMMAGWMIYRLSEMPTTREPTAWAMRTLLEARDHQCIVPKMRAICKSGEQPESAHLRHPAQGGSRLGAALWSIVCPEITPERN